MKAIRLAMCVAFGLGAAAMTGCEDKKADPPKTPGTPAAGATGNPTLDGAMKQAQDVTKGTPAAVDRAKTAAGDAAKNATDAGGAMMASPTAAAPGWMTKLQEAIAANKLDDAKIYLDKLNAVKDKLPENLQTQLVTFQALYDSAKAKAGAIPAGILPGSGNK